MSAHNLSPQARKVLHALADVARKGWIPAVGIGDRSVGMTLLCQLGMKHSVDAKPRLHGLTVSARRGSRLKDENRVNLFAKVPDWDVSALKSSRQIVDTHGYVRDGCRRLYCTVSAKQPNAQGLYLFVDRGGRLLRERCSDVRGGASEVAAWRMDALKERLLEAHPEAVWVLAASRKVDGKEFFHFRFAQFTSMPRVDALASLIDAGTVTVDHLIQSKLGNVREKGPLFKIKPANVEALFPASSRFDLMAV